jgi:acyl dehydratase
MRRQITRDQMIAAKGQAFGTSGWFTVDQARIDAFADITEDRQFIHIDPDRAADTMFGGTIAHGMLTLSMVSAMAREVLPEVVGQSASLNYAVESLRFAAPVRAGACIRGQFTLNDAQVRGRDKLMCRFDVSVEIEGESRPALTAQWLLLYLF